MTDEQAASEAGPSAKTQPAPFYDAPGTASTGAVIGWMIAGILGGTIFLCSGAGLAAFVSELRNPSDMPGLATTACSVAMLPMAGISLVFVLIEYRRRLFLILMGVAVVAGMGLFVLGGVLHG